MYLGRTTANTGAYKEYNIKQFVTYSDVINNLTTSSFVQGQVLHARQGKILKDSIDALTTTVNSKQDILTFDTAPTENSVNPVTSGGLYTKFNLKADKTAAVGSFDLSINNTTYVITLQAKDVNGNNLGTAKTIDLPLESVVVSGSYNNTTKKVILTLKYGSTVDFSVADLISGLQSEITSTNKLSADLVDDTNTTHKFVSATDIVNWNNKQNALVAGTNITIDPNTNTISATGGSSITSINGLAGGTLTSPLTITGGDGATASKIILDTNGNITDSSTSTLFGRADNGASLFVGHSSHALKLRGSATRPTYNGNNMALVSDISALDAGATSVTTTGNGNAVTTASYNASTRQITLTKGITFPTGTIPTKTSQLTNNSGFITTVTALSTIQGARSGYLKFSNGLLIQWGRTGRVNDNGNRTVTFSQEFSAIPSVATSSEYNADDGAWNGAYYVTEGSIATNGFTVHSRGNNNGGRLVTWIAIGYKS